MPNSVPSAGNVSVHLTLRPNSPELFRPPTPGAPPLSLAAVADRYGRSPAEYGALESYFESYGLSILHTDATRLSLTVSGPAASVGAAFGTTLRNGSWNGSSVRFPAELPALPPELAPMVTAVSGLSDGFSRFTLPISGVRPDAVRPTGALHPGRSTNVMSPSAAHLAYGLDDLYNFSGGTHWATGQAIVLLLWGDGFDPADIQHFFSNFYPAGFPAVNISWYPIDQAPAPDATARNDPSHAPQELTLDIEWAGSAAPGATLDAVYAPDGPASRNYSPSDVHMEDALTTAVQLAHVRAISMSFGTPDRSDPSFQVAFETGFASATARGITLLAASGDNGGAQSGGGCAVGGPAPQYPAASPQVLAVGGTASVLNQTLFGVVSGLASETAWNGSGGGFSPTYADPPWQSVGSAKGVVAPTGHRGIPDVAGPAAFNRFYYAGQAMAGNGTSFATPFWAGLVTEMDTLLPQPLGFVNPRIYQLGAAEENGTKARGLVDVTGESGGACLPASTGWDSTTGWGTPRAGLLFEDLVGTFVDVRLSATPSEVAPGGTVEVDVHVLNSSSRRPIDALPVEITLLAGGGYLGPCGGTMAAITVTTNAKGNGSGGVTVPACYFGNAAKVVVVINALGYFGGNSTTLSIDLLGLAGFLAIAHVYPYNVLIFAAIMGAALTIGLLLGRRRRRAKARPAAAPAADPIEPKPAPDPAAVPPGALGPVPDPGVAPGPQDPPPAPVEDPFASTSGPAPVTPGEGTPASLPPE
jgi:kumamolisin